MKPAIIFGYIILFFLIQTAQGCNDAPESKKITSDSTVFVKPNDDVKSSTTGDEQLFRKTLSSFKEHVKGENKAKLSSLFYFPLQTTPQWTNDELKNTTFAPKEGLINQTEFLTYFDDVFTKEAVKLIQASTEEDLSEIDKATLENYYQTLQQITDKGSALYELQKQYTEDNGKETSFGFVFGKVGGIYKVISYYRPWPLK
jgi:hypothetical protein